MVCKELLLKLWHKSLKESFAKSSFLCSAAQAIPADMKTSRGCLLALGFAKVAKRAHHFTVAS